MTIPENGPEISTESASPGENGKRRNVSGDNTRILLIETAERLFAERGIDAVSLREIRLAAGQSNSSVVTYHFGSKVGLIQAILDYRRNDIKRDRDAMIEQMRADGTESDARALIWLHVRPLVNSLRSGSRFVPFLDRLSEERHARTRFGLNEVSTPYGYAAMEELWDAFLGDIPERVKRIRTYQTYLGIQHLLAEVGRTRDDFTEAQLCVFVDGWVGMLSAPVSEETNAALSLPAD